MIRYKIRGRAQLNGKIVCSGSKNESLSAIAIAMLSGKKISLLNTPNISDVVKMTDMISSQGAKCRRLNGVLSIHARKISTTVEDGMNLRYSLLMLEVLLARYGKASVPLPDGCKIGSRGFDMHSDSLSALGAKIKISNGRIEAIAKNGLRGTTFQFYYPTFTGTINFIMAACMASGYSVLENAAINPEIIHLVDLLNSMGATIRFDGRRVRIWGSTNFSDTTYSIEPDRMEAVTYLLAGLITGGLVEVVNITPSDIRSEYMKIIEMGGSIYFPIIRGIGIHPRHTYELPISSTHICTGQYPGFHTDTQPLFMSALTVASGKSLIVESILDKRFTNVPALRAMGAEIETYITPKLLCPNGLPASSAIISGNPGCLHGANVEATDLRCGASLVLAALAAEGETIISEVNHIERGYENMHIKLESLGADIERIEEDE